MTDARSRPPTWTALPLTERVTRPTWLLELDAFDAWPHALPFEDRPFAVLLITDDRDAGEDGFAAYGTWARRVTDQGLDYLCTWGPDCARLHDVMDENLVEYELAGQPAPFFVMTTWHPDESLDDALFFLQACTLPMDGARRPAIFALVGRPDLVGPIHAWAQHPVA